MKQLERCDAVRHSSPSLSRLGGIICCIGLIVWVLLWATSYPKTIFVRAPYPLHSIWTSRGDLRVSYWTSNGTPAEIEATHREYASMLVSPTSFRISQNVSSVDEFPHGQGLGLWINLRPWLEIHYVSCGEFEGRTGGSITQGLITIPFALVAMVLGFFSLALFWMGRRRYEIGHCQNCGYDLRATMASVCSECGVTIERPVSRMKDRILLYGIALSLLMVGYFGFKYLDQYFTWRITGGVILPWVEDLRITFPLLTLIASILSALLVALYVWRRRRNNIHDSSPPIVGPH